MRAQHNLEEHDSFDGDNYGYGIDDQAQQERLSGKGRRRGNGGWHPDDGREYNRRNDDEDRGFNNIKLSNGTQGGGTSKGKQIKSAIFFFFMGKNKEVWKSSPTWDNSKGAKQDFKFDKAKPKMDYKDLASTTTTATVEPEIGAPTQPTFNPTIESLVVENDFPVLDSDQSTENSSDSDHEDLFHEDDVEYESDVHEENINLRAEKRSYQRRKRTERVPKDPEEVPVAEVGPDVGFDETEPVDKKKQKWLTSTVKHFLPEVEHRMCARHILANWAKDYRGLERRNQFWKCARSTCEAELKANLAHMALLGNKDIVPDLLHYDVKTWCKMYFRTDVKCDSIDNNMVESFNAWILAPRHKTIITMLEEIRVKDSVVAGPSNEAGTSRAISKPRERPRMTHITTTIEAPATNGEPHRPKGRHVNLDAPPPRPRGRPRKTTNNEAPAISTIGRERDTSPNTTPARGRGIDIGRADTTPARGRGIGIGRTALEGLIQHLQGEKA
uniref:Transposon protein, Mutator sub-class n=1 Tax=Solanum tuberosum TaxID=4113 RepID=M1BH26_SOLTU